jgi:Flp pilus assembly pilin Flp
MSGMAMIEYVVLLLAILTALISFSYYVKRSLQGNYRKAGENFGYGREYSPTATLECAYDDKSGLWYSTACFHNKVVAFKCKDTVDYFSCATQAMGACTTGCTN